MINIIVAMDKNFLIGKDGKIPWDIQEDLHLFKERTLNSVVIMGRKTFESIGFPLPNRINIVVSNSYLKENIKENIEISSSLKNAIDIAKEYNKNIFIIGGYGIYKEAVENNFFDELYISHIEGNYNGDVYFPKINFKNFEILEEIKFEKFTFKRYSKKLG